MSKKGISSAILGVISLIAIIGLVMVYNNGATGAVPGNIPKGGENYPGKVVRDAGSCVPPDGCISSCEGKVEGCFDKKYPNRKFETLEDCLASAESWFDGFCSIVCDQAQVNPADFTEVSECGGGVECPCPDFARPEVLGDVSNNCREFGTTPNDGSAFICSGNLFVLAATYNFGIFGIGCFFTDFGPGRTFTPASLLEVQACEEILRGLG